MRNLFHFECSKLFKAKVFYICAIVLVGIILLLMGTQKLTEVIAQEAIGLSPEEMIYDSPEDQELMESMSLGIFSSARSGLAWVLNALNSTYVFIAFGAFVAVWFIGDYQSRTVQHALTKGYSRTEIFFSKYFSSLLVCLIYAVLAMLVGFIFGSLFWKVGKDFSAKFLLLVLAQFVIIAAFNAMFCFFATLGFKMAPALILSIAIPIVIPMVLSLVDLFSQINGFWEETAEVEEPVLESTKFWLSGMLSGVSKIKAETKDILRAFLGGAGYMGVFTVFSWLLAKKRDA